MLTPIEKYEQFILSIFLKNADLQESDAKAYTYGFSDGVSWLGRRCKALGIDIPDIELFYTEATKEDS